MIYLSKKKSNIQTEIGSYILLCRIIFRHNFLKTSQKLNVILKLNDISILNYNSLNNIFLIKILKKNIKLEFNLLKVIMKNLNLLFADTLDQKYISDI